MIFTLARYNANGTLDTSFGPNETGIVTTVIGSDTDIAHSLILQSDGKIVAGGYSYNGSNNNFALARYINDTNLTPFAQSSTAVR